MKQIKCAVCGNEIDIEETPVQENPADMLCPQDMLNEILLNTREQCTMVDGMIREQIKRKDEQIDKLHSELQYYKDDQATRFINQVMKGVIKVRKDMVKCRSSREWETMSEQELKREYGYILDDLSDLLEQQNIDSYRTAPGERFDRSIHQIQRIEPTDDPALDKTIKQSTGEGYTKSGNVLIAERVIVYQYKA